MKPGDFLSTSTYFLCSGRLSVHFQWLSMLPDIFSLTSVNFACSQETFRELPSTSNAAERTVKLRHLAVHHETFCQLLSTFCAAGRPSVIFRQLSIWLEVLPSHSVNFCAAGRPSVNFHQLLGRTVHLPSISAKFTCRQRTLNHLPATFVKVSCGQETFLQLPSTFLANG